MSISLWFVKYCFQEGCCGIKPIGITRACLTNTSYEDSLRFCWAFQCLLINLILSLYGPAMFGSHLSALCQLPDQVFQAFKYFDTNRQGRFGQVVWDNGLVLLRRSDGRGKDWERPHRRSSIAIHCHDDVRSMESIRLVVLITIYSMYLQSTVYYVI